MLKPAKIVLLVLILALCAWGIVGLSRAMEGPEAKRAPLAMRCLHNIAYWNCSNCLGEDKACSSGQVDVCDNNKPCIAHRWDREIKTWGNYFETGYGFKCIDCGEMKHRRESELTEDEQEIFGISD